MKLGPLQNLQLRTALGCKLPPFGQGGGSGLNLNNVAIRSEMALVRNLLKWLTRSNSSWTECRNFWAEFLPPLNHPAIARSRRRKGTICEFSARLVEFQHLVSWRPSLPITFIRSPV